MRGRRGKEGVTTAVGQWEAQRAEGASRGHVLGLVAPREPPGEDWRAVLLRVCAAESGCRVEAGAAGHRDRY